MSAGKKGFSKICLNPGPATQLFHGLYFIVSYVDILNRTKLSREVGSIPRLVSIDKYNFIVNHLVENVDIIEIVLF